MDPMIHFSLRQKIHRKMSTLQILTNNETKSYCKNKLYKTTGADNRRAPSNTSQKEAWYKDMWGNRLPTKIVRACVKYIVQVRCFAF